MPGVREMLLRDRPSSLWMLRDHDDPTSGPPAPAGIAANAGLVFGESALNEIFSADGRLPPIGPKWLDWSWGGGRTWTLNSTNPSVPFDGVNGPQVTVGPYGLQWDVLAGPDGTNGLLLHATDRTTGADSTYDTTNDSVLLFYVKKSMYNEGLRFSMTTTGFVDIGNSVTIDAVTGIPTSITTGRTINDTTKTFIPASLVGLTVSIASGPGAGQSQPIFANSATSITPRFNWSTAPTTASTYQVSAFYPDTDQMTPVAITLRGTTIPSTRGNLNLPAGATIENIYILPTGSSAHTIYLDELQFFQQRARSVPLVTGTRPEIRSFNTVYNYAPQILTRYPTPSPDAFATGYAARMDGNCAGTTEEILEWAALKWFGDIRAGWISAGGPGDIADLAKSISPQETGWANWAMQGWEQWIDFSGTSSPAVYTLGTFGIGQTRIRYWPYYPHARLSTAWAAEAHMAVLRYLYDGGVSMAGLSLVEKVRRAVGWWSTGSTAYAFGTYACRALGGTSFEDGKTYVGHINSKPWLTMFDGEEFPYETP